MDLASTLKVEEGFIATVYTDSRGFYTIGYGHRCERNYPNVTKSEAEIILANDIKIAMTKAEKLIDKDTPQEVKEIVTAMCFQIKGVGGFTDMLKCIKAKDYKGASIAMLDSLWAKKQTPKRAKRMAKLMSVVK